jgi:hypothetical protein
MFSKFSSKIRVSLNTVIDTALLLRGVSKLNLAVVQVVSITTCAFPKYEHSMAAKRIIAVKQGVFLIAN